MSPSSLGRFELRRVLGQGAQSVVWLAFDPRLEREVAIKLLKGSVGSVPQWLQEARSVSRLTHPNIVPVLEADVQDNQPYLVFEFVPGHTLANVLTLRGALPPDEAVALMLDVLDALVAAHASGIVHRDLKPSNVLIDGDGRARVMDFGITPTTRDASSAAVPGAGEGTPGYISPEAAQGKPASPVMDIFSAGLVLAELLSGRPLIDERDPYRAIHRVVHEQISLPEELDAGVDDALRAIVLRALARDPKLRQPSASVLRGELAQWLGVGNAGAADSGADTESGKANSTLSFLLRRMRHKSDFPAMSNSVLRIQGMASSDTESVGSVTNEILKDVALTNKLLRTVNSAHFARGGGNIRTVSRAVSLVGFNGIRNLALSLVLLEHMKDKAHAQQLSQEFLRSLMAGTIAAELSPLARESEDAFIGAMFQNLGRLLAEFYFPEEAAAVRAHTQSALQPMDESTAATSVLGLSFEALGLGVAKAWGLPDGIRRCMAQPVGKPPPQAPQDTDERLRWMAVAANAVSDVLLYADPARLDARLTQLAQQYAGALGLQPKEVLAAIHTGRQKLVEMASAMDLTVPPGSAAARLMTAPPDTNGARATTPTGPADHLDALELQASQSAATGESERQRAQHVAQTLTAGIQDITQAMLDDFRLNDVLRMVLETMFRAMDFRYIVFCMRDAKIDALTGRFGLGTDVDRVVRTFHVPLRSAKPDLFAAVCIKGADTMISDATEKRIAERLPAWYHQSIAAPTFLLLPLLIKGKPFGLIYADKGAKGRLELDEKELSLLRTLRNQAVLAFKSSG